MAIFKNYFQFESIIHNFEIVVLSAITLPRDQKINHEERDDDLHGLLLLQELSYASFLLLSVVTLYYLKSK